MRFFPFDDNNNKSDLKRESIITPYETTNKQITPSLHATQFPPRYFPSLRRSINRQPDTKIKGQLPHRFKTKNYGPQSPRLPQRT